jgi:hypothetical protein
MKMITSAHTVSISETVSGLPVPCSTNLRKDKPWICILIWNYGTNTVRAVFLTHPNQFEGYPMKIKNRLCGDIFEAYPQSVDLNSDGHYVLRYIIGIENYQGFHFVRAVYDNDEFNTEFEVIP